MPVVIGAKPESTFADPIGLLKDCHRRIERFLSVLAQLRGHTSLTADERQSLETALRYFREMSPKHTADEEESLFPRLRAAEKPELTTALAKVESLENDHARAGLIHREIDRLGQTWLASGTLAPARSDRLSALVNELVDLYVSHIAVEENEVFPLAAALLDKTERESMGAEMAARRGLQGG